METGNLGPYSVLNREVSSLQTVLNGEVLLYLFQKAFEAFDRCNSLNHASKLFAILVKKAIIKINIYFHFFEGEGRWETS